MKKYVACSNKPKEAQWAERAADALDKLFGHHDTDANEYLTDSEYEVLAKAYDILRQFDKMYTTAKRGY